MRNLKKMLSLVMALAMVASFMVVGASAAEFSDVKDIKNTDAVNMLVELGVIKGRDTGSFDPTGIVTRAEMAKMICVVLNGGRDPQLGNSGSTFTDVKGTANAWADPYIAFCANLGIIAGYGDGTFKPSNTVTGTEAAKMLLVALGYQSEITGFTGANWAVNVDVAANKVNLYKHMTLNTTAGLTRDNAALMIYNALNAKTVSYEYTLAPVNGVLTSIPKLKESTKTLLEDAFKAVKVEGIVVANEYARLSSATTDDNKNVIGSSTDAGKTTILVNNYDDQNTYKDIETTFSVATGANALGRVITLYVQPSSTSTKATVMGNAIVSENNKVVVSASGDSIATIADDNDLNITSATMVANNYAGLAKLVDAKAAGTKGIEKILIDNDNDGNVDYVLVNTYVFGKVTAYSAKDDGSITVNVGGKTYTADKSKNVVGFETVAKNDYVTAAFIGGKLNVAKAESVTGTLEAYKTSNDVNTSMTVDGTAHDVAKVAGYSSATDGIMVAYDNKSFAASSAVDNKGTFYLDRNGYIVAAGDVAESTYAYAYVVATGSGTNLDNSRVKVTLEDGTTGIYTINSKSTVTAPEKNKIYAYTMTSTKEIKLSDPTGGATSAVSGTGSFVKGKTAITATATAYTTSKTVFFYQSSEGKDAKVYVGYANAPTVSNAAFTVATNRAKTVVAVAFVSATIDTAEVSDHMFIYKVGSSYANYTEVSAILAGQDTVTTLKVAKESRPITTDKLYLYTVDSDGYYVLGDAKPANLITGETVAHASTTTFVDSKGVEYKVLKDSVLIDNTDDPSTPTAILGSAPAEKDKIAYAVFNGDKEALMIVIDNKGTSSDTGSSATYTTNVTEAAGTLTVKYYGSLTALQTTNAVRAYLTAQDSTISTVTVKGATATAAWANGTSIDYTVVMAPVYKVAVPTVTGGTTVTVTADKAFATAAETVTLTVKAAKNAAATASITATATVTPAGATIGAAVTFDTDALKADADTGRTKTITITMPAAATAADITAVTVALT